ncbi:DUF3618 domain-containing protein [Pilimelia columellifera]|uniref:DUF3618 domain-containing protein n=1 Tax=Pilimelia columellifera subsp. columellifera TaxID=706583 RepID=A0ABP6ASK1_9ACTN
MTTTDITGLREEIAATRANLGDTVEALAAKADVRERLSRSASQTMDRVSHTASEKAVQVGQAVTRMREDARRRPQPWIGGALAAAAVVALIVIGSRRR